MNFLTLVYTKMFKKSREEVYSMDNYKKRGGIREGAGRKSTGRKRDKTISFKVTAEERDYMYKRLDFKKEGRGDSLIGMMKLYDLEDFDINLEDGRLFSIETSQGKKNFTENKIPLYFLEMKIVEWKAGTIVKRIGSTGATSNEFSIDYFKNSASKFLINNFSRALPEEYPEIKPQIEKYIEKLSEVLENYQEMITKYPHQI